MENWRWIPKYEFRYEINDVGQVRGINEGILNPAIDENGLAKVCLRKNGQSTFIPVYYLMASTFIPNPDKHRFVRMKDGDRSNISLNNLEWFTPPQRNIQQPPRPMPSKDNPFNKPVRCIRTGKAYDSIVIASKELSIPPGFIKWMCDNRKPLPNEMFEYIEEDEVESIEI